MSFFEQLKSPIVLSVICLLLLIIFVQVPAELIKFTVLAGLLGAAVNFAYNEVKPYFDLVIHKVANFIKGGEDGNEHGNTEKRSASDGDSSGSKADEDPRPG